MSSDEDEQPFALKFGKRALYKFRPYHSDQDKRRVCQILIDHKIYFARASQLNDPFDMSPRFELPSRDELIAAAKSLRAREPELAHTVDLDYLATCDLKEHAIRATAQASSEWRIPIPFSRSPAITRIPCFGRTTQAHTRACASTSRPT